MTTEIKPAPPIMLYDSECTMCNRFKMGVERMEGSEFLTMISIHDDSIYEFFTELDKEECKEIIHLIDEENNIHKGPDVITYLAKKLPAVKKIAWLIETDVGKKSLDYFYRMAQRYRKKTIKRCGTC